MRDSYDCIVLGGGPAGSTAATLVADAGFSTLLLEREKFPRFHIGESLMPETYWTFKRLGMLEKLRDSHFVKKYSVQFVSHTGKESQPFFFDRHDPRECSQTWQVRRSEFDRMLFDNAAEHGAECRDETRVLDVLFDSDRPDRATGVRIQTADGGTREISARVVVDATGQQSLIGTRLGIRHEDPHLRKSAVWTYYKNAARDSGQNAGATIVLYTQNKDSWFWFIPLEKNVTSIGVVGDRDYLLKQGRGTPEQIYEQELDICPAMRRRLEQAERVEKYFVAKEFTYKSERSSGEGWVLVGDAFSFIDPLYSSGVFFALYTAEQAADCVVEGLRTGDLSREQLGKWTPKFQEGMQWVRKLIDAYYNKEFSFGQFLRAYPQYGPNVTDILIGRIFHKGAGKMFEDLDHWMAHEMGHRSNVSGEGADPEAASRVSTK